MRRFLSCLAAFALIATPLALVSTAAPARAATVIHVDQNAAGFANGTSWTNAFTDLQTALSAATAGDEVRVAAGTYRPATSDRTVSFAPPSGVTVIGGFATGGGVEPMPSAHRTTLTGDLAGDDLPGPLNTGDNSHHVVDVSGTAGVTLFGLTIEAGNTDGAASTAGGGVLNDGATNLRLDTVVVRHNTATSGGGLANLSSSPVIVNSRFQANSANTGGGIYSANGDPTVIGTRIINNAAASGAGIYNENADQALIGSIVAFNAGNVGGGIHNDGSSTTTTNSVVAGNTAASGAGVYSVFATTSVQNSILWDNNGPTIEDAFGASTTATFSVVEGGWPGSGNLSSDPLFEGPADFRLQPASPARDLADTGALPADVHDADNDGDTVEPAPAIDGRSRINGTSADIGAHETAVAFDSFGNAGTLSGASGTVVVANVGATGEPGESAAVCGAAAMPGQSVWLSWTAPASGPMQFDTLGSSFDTVLQVHTGNAVNSLTVQGCNDDVVAAATSDSAVVIDATAGTTYTLQIDGAGAATGTATVQWGPAATVTPVGVVATEGDAGTSTWQMPVTLSGPSTIPVVVDWNIVGLAPASGLATPGIDLADSSGTLTIAPGLTQGSVPIDVFGDTVDEPPLLYGEWALVTLVNPVNTRVTGGLFGTGIVIIIDDD